MIKLLKIRDFILHYRKTFFLGLLLVIVCIYCFMVKSSKQVVLAQNDMIVLAENIRKHYKKRPDYWGLSTQSALDGNIVPKTMVNGDKIVSPIAKEVFIGGDDVGSMIMPGTRSFYIVYKDVSKKDCIDMVTYQMSEQNKLGLLSIDIKNKNNEFTFQWGGKYSLPIDRKTATTACQAKNTILWNFE